MRQCPPGTAADEEGLTECKICPVGMNCANPSQPFICPPGKIPDDLQIGCLPCSAGFFCQDGISTLCPARTYCPNPGAIEPRKCSSGSFCYGGNHTELCPIGSFCSNGTAAECPAGTYCSTDGAFKPSDCPPGSFCLGGEHIEKCKHGTFSIGNASICSLCDSGYFCDRMELSKQVLLISVSL